MNRVRRTVQRKSPSPTAEDPIPASSSVRKHAGFTMFSDTSPILSHRSSMSAGGGGGLGSSYTFKVPQVACMCWYMCVYVNKCYESCPCPEITVAECHAEPDGQ